MLPKGPYNPNTNEEEILDYWLENKLYAPEHNSKDKLATSFLENGQTDERETYTNILPPPNANGNLHLGHMSGYAYQDLMGRYQRMQGKKVLLFPGKDHAGIQTEVVYERELEKQGKSKKDLGREEFYKQCYDFCMKNGEIATGQEKKLGLSADFDRELFTLDPKVVKAVTQTFVDMYNEGLIYRGKRLINWCVRCQSALADIDTEYKDSKTNFFYFKYGFLEPETYALNVRDNFAGKEVEATIELHKGMVQKDLDGNDHEFPFNYSGEIEGEINPADNKNLDVILLGFEEGLKPGAKVKGKAVGLMMRLDKDYKLIVVAENPIPNGKDKKGNDIFNLYKEFGKLFDYYSKYFAGVHIREFEKHQEDKYYTNGIILGTVRPETKFGDTALAVAPGDKRYEEFVGKDLEVLTLNGPAKIRVIADEAVDPNFGTGALKVTPAHAKEDWDIAMRHEAETMPEKQVIGFDGKLNHLTGNYEGMTVDEAREAMIADMDEKGILVKLDRNYENRIQVCERCKHRIEPLISHQWFLDTKPLKEKAKTLVEEGHTKIMPEGKQNVYLNWMNSPEAWCITRQLWWGYRVPVWYKDKPEEYVTETGEVKEKIGEKIIKSSEDYKDLLFVGTEAPGEHGDSSEKQNPNWHQDEDVLDTWFSSGQWPAVTLLAKEGDFDTFYPTQTMETGWDILIFWVTRMMLLCPYKAESVNAEKDSKQVTPFENVYLHGLVLDKEGQKMSKSKGNGIDPYKMMQKYGTDALRLSFVVGNKVGQNYRLYEEKIQNFRNYCNKIWNVSKFSLMNISGLDEDVTKLDPAELPFTETDLEMQKHIDDLVANTTKRMDSFNFGVAASELYESLWHKLADDYLEAIKPRVYTKDKEGNALNTKPEEIASRKAALWTVWYALDKYLRLLHPFIPFITERIWRELPKAEGESETIMYAKWPEELVKA